MYVRVKNVSSKTYRERWNTGSLGGGDVEVGRWVGGSLYSFFVEQCIVNESSDIFDCVLILSHCYKCPVFHFQARRSLYSISILRHHYTVLTEVGGCTYSKPSLIRLQLLWMSDNPDQNM
jgi:hypothetical protein